MGVIKGLRNNCKTWDSLSLDQPIAPKLAVNVSNDRDPKSQMKSQLFQF